MADFLLFFEKFHDYDKIDIDKGNTPPEIYKICSCIRNTFCISYGIKKKNNLFLYFQKDKALIKFSGNKLRYLGPDERNQALLLKKAFDKLNNEILFKSNDWVESTPGIYVKKLNNAHSIVSFLNKLNLNKITFISDLISPFNFGFLYHYFDVPNIKKFKQVKNLKEQFFIIPSNKTTMINLLRNIVQSYPSMLEFITIATLDKIKTISDKILYINFQIDQIRTLK
ncbi:MAG: hypothetical protein ACFFBP_11235 [Promethearchaeota archaeon]